MRHFSQFLQHVSSALMNLCDRDGGGDSGVEVRVMEDIRSKVGSAAKVKVRRRLGSMEVG